MALIKCPECGREISDKATTCVNCGCPVVRVNPLINCPECGKEISDKATTCVNCGCPVVRVNPVVPVVANPNTEPRSPYYDRILAYHRATKSYFVFGILSLALCLGIGLIFQIICYIKSFSLSDYKRLIIKKDIIMNYPEEWLILTEARSRQNKGRTMFIIGTIITSLILFVLFVMLMTEGF